MDTINTTKFYKILVYLDKTESSKVYLNSTINKKPALDQMEGIKSFTYNNGNYVVSSMDAWEHFNKLFKSIIETKKISCIPELLNAAENYWDEYVSIVI